MWTSKCCDTVGHTLYFARIFQDSIAAGTLLTLLFIATGISFVCSQTCSTNTCTHTHTHTRIQMQDPSATIGKGCRIGPNVIIGPNVVIEDGTQHMFICTVYMYTTTCRKTLSGYLQSCSKAKPNEYRYCYSLGLWFSFIFAQVRGYILVPRPHACLHS